MDGLVGRLLALVDLLQGRGRMTVDELSSHLEVSERTIRRDLTKLESLDIPVEVSPGRNGGVRLEGGSLFHALRFTDDEILALSLGLVLVRQSSGSVSASVIASASSRLASVMTGRLRERLASLQDVLATTSTQNLRATHQQPSGLVLDIAEAIQRKHVTRLSYRSRQDSITTRVVNPYGMVYLQPYWYIAGYCHLREDIRTFRLDRVRRAEVLDETFLKPPAFDTLAVVSKAIAQTPTGGVVCEVMIEASMEEATRLIPPTAALLEPCEKGVLLKARCGPEQLSRLSLHLLGLPFPLTVIGPESLRDALYRVSEKARSLAITFND